MPRVRIHEGGGGKRVCRKRLSGCRGNRLSQPAAAVLVNGYLYMAFKVKEEVKPSHNKCGRLIMVLWSICRPIKKRGNQTQEVNTSLLQVAAKPAYKNVCMRKCQAKQKAAHQATENNVEHALHLDPCYRAEILSSLSLLHAQCSHSSVSLVLSKQNFKKTCKTRTNCRNKHFTTNSRTIECKHLLGYASITVWTNSTQHFRGCCRELNVITKQPQPNRGE